MKVFKIAQNLEVVKTPEKFTNRELTRAIRDAIIAELGAIKQYETVVDATDNEKVKKTLQDISNEEKIPDNRRFRIYRQQFRQASLQQLSGLQDYRSRCADLCWIHRESSRQYQR